MGRVFACFDILPNVSPMPAYMQYWTLDHYSHRLSLWWTLKNANYNLA